MGHKIHPVECYRLWDENLSTVDEIEHLSAAWQMVAPFLKEHGYTLVPQQDVETPFESRGELLGALDLRDHDNVEPVPIQSLACRRRILT